MYNPEELAQIIIDQNHVDPRSLTTMVEHVPAETWSAITGWAFEESKKAGRYDVEPEILGATLVSFYAELVEAQVGPKLYEKRYQDDAPRIKAALGTLESVAIAIVAGRNARDGETRQEVIERSRVELIDHLLKSA